MKLEVTRHVVSDLWPLYSAKEASGDSRALVEAFLAGDEAFRAVLQESSRLTRAVPEFRLSADAERRLLDDARSRARLRLLVIGGAVAMSGLLAFFALRVLLLKAMQG